MKILVISPVLAPPVNRGNKARIFTLCRHLIQMGHNVHFYALPYTPFDETELVVARHFWREKFHSPDKKFVYHFGSKSLWRRFWQKMALITGWNQLWGKSQTQKIDARVDFRLRSQLKRLQKEHQFDAVVVNYVYLSRYLRCFNKKVLKVIDAHDVFTHRHTEYLKHGLENHMISLKPRSEKRGLKRADVVMAIQEEEQAFLQKMTKKPVVTVGHVLKIHTRPEIEEEPNSILFVGAANQINELGVKTFIQKVLPVVRKELPKAELWVAGSVCNLLEEQEGVALLGQIHDLSAVYCAASVVVNPCPFGTGLKIKTIEALSHCRPLVCTPAAAAGLKAGAETAFKVAPQIENFAPIILELLKSQSLRKNLSQNARQFMQNYNAEQLATLKTVFKPKNA